MSALRSFRRGSATFVTLTGYDHPGDEGGGTFRFDAADTVTPDNGGTVVVGPAGERWKLVLSGTLWAAQFGAKGDGVTDDTGAFERALHALEPTGGDLSLNAGRRYRLTRRLIIPSGCGLVDETHTAELYAPASAFDNTSLANRYRTNSAVLDASGERTAPFTPAHDIRLRGFKLRSEVQDGRMLDAITARNVEGLIIEGLEISGFPVGCGLRLASLRGATSITGNWIHDFADDTDWTAQAPQFPQLTGIEIDNDLVNGQPSVGVRIVGNAISNLTVGPLLLDVHGYQTDGINVAHHLSHGHVIEGNVIEHVGEGIDFFGRTSTLSDNTVRACFIFGLKLIHGASFNVVSGNTVEGAGLAGIVLAGTSSSWGDTEGNLISGNVIRDIDPDGSWSPHSTACISFMDNGGVGRPRRNLVNANIFSEGDAGKYGWLDSSTGGENFGQANTITPGAGNSRRVLVQFDGGSTTVMGEPSGLPQTNLR